MSAKGSGKRVLITGVAGMIGSHLIDELLEHGYEVKGFDNLSYGKLDNIRHHLAHPRFHFHRGDIADRHALVTLAADVDCIVHLAAVKKVGEHASSIPTLTVNAHGTENVFEAAKLHGIKVVYASTSDVYGMTEDLPFREDGDLLLGPSTIGRWSYAVSKLYGEQVAYAYHKDHGVPIVVLRYFGAFSPRSSFSWSGGHVPIFIHAILHDQEVVIHGDGKQTRSMAFVADVVTGTRLAMESEKAIGEIVNLGNTEELSVVDTARLIHELAKTPWDLKLKFVPMKEVFGTYREIARRVPDISKAERLFGYRPQVPLRKGIEITLAEARKQR